MKAVMRAGVTAALHGQPVDEGCRACRVEGTISRSVPSNGRSGRRSGIVLIDECALRRDCTCGLLRIHFRDGTRSFGATEEFLEQLVPSSYGPRGIILSTGMREVADEAILFQLRSIVERAGSAPLMLLSDRDDSTEHLVMAFREGVRGYILTTMEPHLVIGAIRLVLDGGTFIPAETLIRHALETLVDGDSVGGGENFPTTPSCGTADNDRWSEPYRSILHHVLQGRTNKEIGRALRLEENTIKTHVRQIMRKMGVVNRTQLAIVIHRQQFSPGIT